MVRGRLGGAGGRARLTQPRRPRRAAPPCLRFRGERPHGALIMAAGQGTRMRSDVPKVLHEVCGRPMVAWPILAAREAGAGRVCVIVSPDSDLSRRAARGDRDRRPADADGTGGALRAAREVDRRQRHRPGPLRRPPAGLGRDHRRARSPTHEEAGAGATVMTTELDDPGTYGRIVRGGDGDVEQIVEAKEPGDATAEELAITRGQRRHLRLRRARRSPRPSTSIGNDNAQGEYYLGDVLPADPRGGRHDRRLRVAGPRRQPRRQRPRRPRARDRGGAPPPPRGPHAKRRHRSIDPASTWIDADVELEPDVTLAARHLAARRDRRSAPARSSAR